MKRVIVSGVVLVLLFSFCLSSHLVIMAGVDEMEQAVDRAIDALQQEDWSAVDQHTQQAHRAWMDRRLFFSLVARHEAYDQVWVSIQKLPRVVDTRDSEAVLDLILTLHEQLTFQRSVESFSWYNVF